MYDYQISGIILDLHVHMYMYLLSGLEYNND
jgi:hypothetical protein